MKRAFFPIFAALSVTAFTALAQTTPAPSTQELQEKVERLSGDVERLSQDNLLLRNKVTALSEELTRAREEMTKATANTGVQDELSRLSKKIQEVDEKRAHDASMISEQISKLGRELASTPPPPRSRTTHTTEPTSRPEAPEKGFKHKVESGDTLSTIVVAYNDAFKKQGSKTITMKQVMDANPSVNWNRLRVGQEIIIPAPSK